MFTWSFIHLSKKKERKKMSFTELRMKMEQVITEKRDEKATSTTDAGQD